MRLIDADPIMQRLTYNNGTPTVDNYRDGAPVTLALREIKDLIQNAPTVSLLVKTSDRFGDHPDAVRGDGMAREEAAQMLKRLKHDYQNGADENDCFYEMYLYALDTAITILTSPWVKTADRLPEDHEMLNGCVPIVDERGYGSVQKRRVLERYPKDYPWWLPLPALPEKEDGTPVIARRDYPQKPTSGLIEEDA